MKTVENQVVLKALELTKTFFTIEEQKVLKGISLEVRRGETVAIMGKSGEGKTTLLHILGSLEKPCSGHLEICKKNALIHPPSDLRNKHIGFIFQSYNLLEDYTVLENVLMPAKIARQRVDQQSSAFNDALHFLDYVDLSSKMHHRAKILSGGEKQRAAIARALINNPDLILADEPSGSLDRLHSLSINHLLLNTAKHMNKSLIIVTHDEELAHLCDQIFLLREGVLVKKK